MFEPPNPGIIEEMKMKAKQVKSRPFVSTLMTSIECSNLESAEMDPFVIRALVASRDGNPQTLYQVIDDYRKFKRMNLIEEDVVDLLNKAYMGKWACIHYACYDGSVNFLRALLNLQANCNMVTDDHWTPLQLATYEGHTDCVNLLATHPTIQINKMTAERGTALHIAVMKGNTEIVHVLLRNKAAPFLEDQFHKTPIELCSNEKVRDMLVKYEAKAKSHAKSQNEQPLSFSGEVWFSAKWQINDKKVYLVLDTTLGVFKHYNKRSNYIDDIPADFQVPIKDIQDVCVSARFGEKVVFTVETKESSMIYFCEFPDMTREWHHKIVESLNFFHLFLYDPANRAARQIHEENKYIRSDMSQNREEPYSVGDTLINESSFEKLEEIGSGTFGKVFKVSKKDTEEIYAIKVLRKATLKNKNQLKYAISECKTLKIIRHPFIIPLEYGFQSDTHIYMVMEYCPYGDFTRLLNHYKKLPESTARFYISETILAIEYLHSLNIVYRDLKPSNLLIDREGHIKLADFSLAKENVTQNNPAMSFCGTPAYLPPEILNNSGAYKPADIYCIGVNLYEMLTGSPPFSTKDLGSLYKAIASSRLKFPAEVSEDARDLIKGVMDRNPENRPNIQRVKNHKFFRDVNWESLYRREVRPPICPEDLGKITTVDCVLEKIMEESII